MALPRFVTKSHDDAFNILLATGRLFFSWTRVLPKIKLRLFPLLIGPTGVGKSYLVETAAHAFQAEYFKIARGDWLVTGCRTGRPTVFQILDRVSTYDRVLLHIDELDKFSNLNGQEWSAAISSDLWGILDGKLPITEYLRETTFPDREKPTERQLALRVQKILWIVGSGTWQSVFTNSDSGSAIGFYSGKITREVDISAIARAEMISPELLYRFGEPVFLKYPTLEETELLLQSTGIAQMANQVGIIVSADQIDYRQGGMRVLETLATRVAIAYTAQNASARAMVTSGPDISNSSA